VTKPTLDYTRPWPRERWWSRRNVGRILAVVAVAAALYVIGGIVLVVAMGFMGAGA
jgi:hypothetical protein